MRTQFWMAPVSPSLSPSPASPKVAHCSAGTRFPWDSSSLHLAFLLPGVAGRTAPEEALNVAQAGREARGRGQRGLGQHPSPHLDTHRARTHDTDLLGLQNAPAISRLLSSARAEEEQGRSPRGAGFPLGICIFFLKSKQTWKSLGQAQLILVSNENSRWPRGSDLPGRARALQPCRLQARAGRGEGLLGGA